MKVEMIIKEKHPDIYAWLSKHISNFDDEGDFDKFTLVDNRIDCDCNVDVNVNTTCFKYPFGYVVGDFDCSYCNNLTSLIGAPIRVNDMYCYECLELKSIKGCPEIVRGCFSCEHCTSLKSLIGFPKHIGKKIRISNCQFSNSVNDEKGYNLYIDLWFELLESVSENEKWEYINNYKDRVESFNNLPIIPKEVMNKYKIDFLLKK